MNNIITWQHQLIQQEQNNNSSMCMLDRPISTWKKHCKFYGTQLKILHIFVVTTNLGSNNRSRQNLPSFCRFCNRSNHNRFSRQATNNTKHYKKNCSFSFYNQLINFYKNFYYFAAAKNDFWGKKLSVFSRWVLRIYFKD